MTRVRYYKPRTDKWRAQYWPGLPSGIVNEYELRAALLVHGYPEQALKELYEEINPEEEINDASNSST